MKKLIKPLLILIVFTLLHEGMRLVYTHALNAYEMSLPHCCVAVSLPLIWTVVACDFFFNWPREYYYLSDLIWGSIATGIYLWVEKRGSAKRLAKRLLASQQKAETPPGVWPPAPKSF